MHLCYQQKHWKIQDGELANVPNNIAPVWHLRCYNFFLEETLYLFQTYLLVYVSSLLLQLNAYCLILLSSVTNREPDMLVHLVTELHKYSVIVCEMWNDVVKLEIDKLLGLTYDSEEDTEHKV